MRSLGIYSTIRKEKKDFHLGSELQIVLEFDTLLPEFKRPSTGIVHAMVRGAADGYCEEHGLETLLRADFSQLSSATRRKHKHKDTNGGTGVGKSLREKRNF